MTIDRTTLAEANHAATIATPVTPIPETIAVETVAVRIDPSGTIGLKTDPLIGTKRHVQSDAETPSPLTNVVAIEFQTTTQIVVAEVEARTLGISAKISVTGVTINPFAKARVIRLRRDDAITVLETKTGTHDPSTGKLVKNQKTNEHPSVAARSGDATAVTIVVTPVRRLRMESTEVIWSL